MQHKQVSTEFSLETCKSYLEEALKYRHKEEVGIIMTLDNDCHWWCDLVPLDAHQT